MGVKSWRLDFKRRPTTATRVLEVGMNGMNVL
jgi:hypothetical protein